MINTEARRKIATLLVEAKRIASSIEENEVAYFIGMAGLSVIDAQNRAVKRDRASRGTAIPALENLFKLSVD